ncbi:hypothetical protein MJO28_011241 [Puccinia striiformis f. sp. tritici]|uniref:Uncharacterized protein n=1 Tax=Puccinia striiformis f. sp. tritici TaxID=168172 RepID=A0ACC0E3I8_9BASI|nr:hypothetical protein Pst134EB_021718 [Puccinia striiformis f. sp. tritici]KAI7943713.1 hypothetical protein MJO28_011241 [Puccinia striiformis f. sp. tritici]
MKQDSCDAVNSPNPRSLANGPGSYVTTTAPRKFANPAPLGLCSFAATTFLLSLMNLQTRGIKTESVIISMAYGYGGMIQVLAGMWEFACGNTFGATAFSSYGGFWISFGLILSPNSGILAAYANKKHELESALGLYLFSWFIFTTIMLLGSLRTSVALVALFSFLDVTFLLLAIGKLSTHAAPLTKAGGVFGVITAFIAWYVAAAGLLEAENSFIRLPTIPLGKSELKTRSVDSDRNDHKD